MAPAQTHSTTPERALAADYDATIIGAGMAGMYPLRELGLTVRVFETGGDVGNTGDWNRYPGPRFDSESCSDGYSLSEDLLKEWDWTEHVYETAEFSLPTKVDSGFMGVNQNLPDKKPRFMAYLGGSPTYRARCEEEATSGCKGFVLEQSSRRVTIADQRGHADRQNRFECAASQGVPGTHPALRLR